MHGFIVFTTEKGGQYQTTRGSIETFNEARDNGEIVCGYEDDLRAKKAKLAYIAFAPIADDFDFVLGRQRDVIPA